MFASRLPQELIISIASAPVAVLDVPRQRGRHRAAPPQRAYGRSALAVALAGAAVAAVAAPAQAADAPTGDAPSTTGSLTAVPPARAPADAAATATPASSPAVVPAVVPAPAAPVEPLAQAVSGSRAPLPGSYLAAGSRGDAVRSWQQALAQRGASLAVDGSFGPRTVSATLAFQRAAGVRVDGVVGPQTRAAMSGGAASASTGAAEVVQTAAEVASAPASSGSAVVAAARKQLGVPYVYGGTSTRGFDCSGLTQHVLREMGVSLPRTSGEQARAGRAVSAARAGAGDLVVFWSGNHVYHVGIYLGDGMMIAAPKPGDRVKVEKVYSSNVTYRRVI